jgi:predicted dehydrogenase
MDFDSSRRRFLRQAGAAGLTFHIMKPSTALGSEANSKVEVGCIGLGGRGAMIAGMFQKHGGFRITSVADYFPETATKAGARFEVASDRRFSGLSGYRKLLASGVDAVVLKTPPYCFPEHARAAVEAGCHVYMAKPVACDVPGTRSISKSAQMAREKQLVFLVDFQTRTDPFIQEGVRRVREGEIGKLAMLETIYADECFRDPPFGKTVENRLKDLVWVNDSALGASYIVNCDIHAIDVALWIAGSAPVSAVGSSRRARPNPHGDSHDVYSVTYEYDGGLLHSHRSEHVKNRHEFRSDCLAHAQEGHLETAYDGMVRMLGLRTGYRGGAVKGLYQRGPTANIAAFHRDILSGDASNPSVQPAIDANHACILGREASFRGTNLTMNAVLKENKALVPDLSGLSV